MGRGLVEPVDDLRDANPGTHPELLALLASEFRRGGFDIHYLLRAITSSEPSSRHHHAIDGNRDDVQWYSHMPIKVLSPYAVRRFAPDRDADRRPAGVRNQSERREVVRREASRVEVVGAQVEGRAGGRGEGGRNQSGRRQSESRDPGTIQPRQPPDFSRARKTPRRWRTKSACRRHAADERSRNAVRSWRSRRGKSQRRSDSRRRSSNSCISPP